MRSNLFLTKYSFAAAFLLVVCFGCNKATSSSPASEAKKTFPVPKINLQPHQYVVYKTARPLTIDGKLNEDAWKQVRWTSDYVDISGDTTNTPKRKTRAKLLWDGKYLYIGIQLKEKNVWGTMTKRDAPLYVQNAAEIFIDPDGDTHNYLELGVNPLSNIYDLLLPKPYRDGGQPVSAYNILGLKVDVAIDGTLNDPEDTDIRWTAEVALPLKALRELNMEGGQKLPRLGDQWRFQLARAERPLTVSGDSYTIKKNPATGKPVSEVYTSWAPQGLINLHYPEMWGYVQFSGKIAGQGHDDFKQRKSEQIKWALRKMYYRQKQYYSNHQTYTSDLSKLGGNQTLPSGFDFSPKIYATPYTFLISVPGFDNEIVWFINQNGKVWHKKTQHSQN